MRVSAIFLLVITLLASVMAAAAKPEIYSHRYKGAVKGVDVVAYHSLPAGAEAVKGEKEHSFEYKDATWYFANAENKALFKANPERYVPAYGGYCAFAVSHGFVTSPRPDSWKLIDGKVYLNNNKKSFQKWEDKQDEKIQKADANWPSVLGK